MMLLTHKIMMKQRTKFRLQWKTIQWLMSTSNWVSIFLLSTLIVFSSRVEIWTINLSFSILSLSHLPINAIIPSMPSMLGSSSSVCISFFLFYVLLYIFLWRRLLNIQCSHLPPLIPSFGLTSMILYSAITHLDGVPSLQIMMMSVYHSYSKMPSHNDSHCPNALSLCNWKIPFMPIWESLAEVHPRRRWRQSQSTDHKFDGSQVSEVRHVETEKRMLVHLTSRIFLLEGSL